MKRKQTGEEDRERVLSQVSAGVDKKEQEDKQKRDFV